MRGLIVSRDIVINVERGEAVLGPKFDLHSQHLRHWMLMWDHLAVPVNGNALCNPTQDLDFLRAEGFATYLPVDHNGGEPAQTTREVFLGVVYHLESQQPGSWTSALGPGALEPVGPEFFPEEDTVAGRGALVQLTNVIPVPEREVPLADILEFKSRRQPELLALRHHIEEIYQRIAASTDPALALNSGLEALETASNDYVRTMREGRLPFKFATDLASINFVPAGIALGAGYLAHSPLATLLGNVAAAGLTVSAGIEWSRRTNSPSPFRYITSYHEEVFGL
jgi:hypothetical protein